MRASDAHHHLSSSNKDIVGARYRQLLEELACITEYQWRAADPRGVVKGFLLSGPPGTGKTTLAKQLAYEMARRFSGALTYVVDYPDQTTLIEMTENIHPLQQLPASEKLRFKTELISAVQSGTVRSMRDAQRFAMRHFVSSVINRNSLADHAGD